MLVEDQLLLRDLLTEVCEKVLGHRVIEQTGFGATAVRTALELKPDIIVIDVGLPDVDGLDVACDILRLRPSTRILVLTGRTDPVTVYRVEHSGVHGFVDKNSGAIGVFRNALIEIAAGRSFFSEAYHTAKRARLSDPFSFEKLLSKCEQRVLTFVGRGFNDGEVASELGISISTAQTHRSRILRKLELRGTPKLMVFAQETGFA